ncbi:MAG: hypothetical protein IJB83_00950 [Bacilli bacterium]|nr:hypothetical protein [Bacilli bacterium]
METVISLSEKLKEPIKKYEELYSDKIFTLTLEDDTYINFNIPKHNFPHLLGIQSDYYNRNITNYKTMYHFMLSLIENPQKYQNKIYNHEANFYDFFSKYCLKKATKFNLIENITKDTIPFIIEHNPYVPSKLKYGNSNYYIFFTNDLKQSSGFLLGVKKEENTLTPITLVPVNNLLELKIIIGGNKLELVKQVEIKQKGTTGKTSFEKDEEELDKIREELQSSFIVTNPKLEEELRSSKDKDILRKTSHQLTIARNNLNKVIEASNDYIHSLLSDYYEERQQTLKLIKDLNEKSQELEYANNHPLTFALKKVFKRNNKG